MSDTTALIEVLNTIADNSSDLKFVHALREAQTALVRLSAIKAAHQCGVHTTDGGRIVYPSIHGHVLQDLLYGDLDPIEE
jgi:hypothetical protein